MDAIRGIAYIRATLFSFGMISRLSIFISLVTYIFLGNVITAQKVFVVFSFFNILNLSMVYFWPLALTSVAEGYISAKRIEEFLLTSERKPGHLENVESEIIKSSDTFTSKRTLNSDAKMKSIVMRNVTATWNHENNHQAGIYDFNLEIPDGSLCAVVGPVGSGESVNFGELIC